MESELKNGSRKIILGQLKRILMTLLGGVTLLGGGSITRGCTPKALWIVFLLGLPLSAPLAESSRHGVPSSKKSSVNKKKPKASLTSATQQPVEIDVLDAFEGPQAEIWEDLLKRFNDSQRGVLVSRKQVPIGLDAVDYALQTVRAKNAATLIQLPEDASDLMVSIPKSFRPMQSFLSGAGIPDQAWFLSNTSNFMRDKRGRLLALPWMATVPVFIYNRDAYKAAGLDPNRAPRTWGDLQAQLITLQAKGARCPLASSWQGWIHVENIAALHNTAYASLNNGTDGPSKAQLLFNDLLHVRHIALLNSWVKSALLPHAPAQASASVNAVSPVLNAISDQDQADSFFINEQCTSLLSSSAAIASLQENATFSWAVSPLPFYEEAAQIPSSTFVGGSSWWITEGQRPAQYKALATFIKWLLTPVITAEWHQKTGFLPLTEAAYRAAKVSYYDSVPGMADLVHRVVSNSGAYTRGVHLYNERIVNQIVNQELDQVWRELKAPKAALDDAVRRGNEMIKNPHSAAN